MKKMGHNGSLILAAAVLLLVVDAVAKSGLFLTPFFPLSLIRDAAATTTAATSTSCAVYQNSTSTIRVICDTTFEQLEKDIGDKSVIENIGNGEYLLRANIEVANKVRLTIASPAVTWLKISNEQDNSSQYNILVRGYMDMDGVKVTSWDPKKNSVVGQDSSGSVPRPYIVYERSEGAIIQNSELAYIGFHGNLKRGLSFIDGSNSIKLTNNDIHHFWYAFYSNGARNITVDGNRYHDNYMYAIDPHTGTRDMNITNNLVFDNAGIGIICSLDCRNILIENNTVYNHTKTGISLSRNTHDSIVRNNVVYNSTRGIVITESPDNDLYNNVIFNVSDGFYLVHPPVPDDGPTTDNRIYNNTVINADRGISSHRAYDNIFSNNSFDNIKASEYHLYGGAKLEIRGQHFTDDAIAAGSGANTVTISESGLILIGQETKDLNTDKRSYTTRLSDDTLSVESVKTILPIIPWP